jgi:hypothetical protein
MPIGIEPIRIFARVQERCQAGRVSVVRRERHRRVSFGLTGAGQQAYHVVGAPERGVNLGSE